ncbi:MAG: metallopeptidase TldD-related protein [Myxococcota bacterium]|nr:metallopeptidase TldD-related protein [Myxococcota bacterium]
MGAPNTPAMNAEPIVANAIARAKQAGAAACDVVLVESESSNARVRGEEIEFVKQAKERGLGIRVLYRDAGHGDGLSSAITSTSDLSPQAVDRMADETVALARATAPDPFAGLPESGFATDIPNLSLFDPADAGAPVESRIEDAFAAEAAARNADERITNSEGSQVGSDASSITYGNSEGFLSTYRSGSHTLFSEPLAQDESGMQRDYWMTVGRSLSALDDPASVGREAAARALRRLGGKRVATCEVPIIFDARTSPSLIRQLVSCLSGYSIYRESSFLASRMGEKIASELVTISDDPLIPSGLGSKPFDGEGLPTRHNVIVEGGELKTWLLDSYSARKLGLESTGSASRGLGSAPSVGTSNLSLSPGDGGSLDDIVSDTKRGLLVTELIGMGFNPVTGDYSRGAAGLWIENGEIVHPVEEITIAGNLGDMLAAIDCVGSELRWLSSAAAPPLRISKMTVAGE